MIDPDSEGVSLRHRMARSLREESRPTSTTPRPVAVRARLSGAFSPTPPVKTSTAKPSIAATMRALPAQRRCV